MNKENISNGELLDELSERVKKNDITFDIFYLYDEEKMVFRVKSPENRIDFWKKWDIKCSARYRQNYENYCLPLVEEKQNKELNQKLEILKAKINYDPN